MLTVVAKNINCVSDVKPLCCPITCDIAHGFGFPRRYNEGGQSRDFYRLTVLVLDLFPQGGIKLKRRIKIKDERIKLTCRSHTFKTVLKVRRGNTLAGIYEMVYSIILPSIRYSFLVY